MARSTEARRTSPGSVSESLWSCAKEFVVPRGDTRTHAGDQVIVVGPPAIIKKAQAVFLLKKWNGLNSNGLLDEPANRFSGLLRRQTVESKRESVKIVIEAFVTRNSRMRFQQRSRGHSRAHSCK